MIRRLGTITVWLLLALLAALALAMVVVPRLLGWIPLTILTGSMEPTIPTGSQVVVEQVEGEADAAQLTLGDVVTFMPYADDPTLVTHRIVGRSASSDGVTFTTQGDNNDVEDPWTVGAEQLRGVVKYHIPYAGHLATALDGNQKSTGIVIAAVALFGYAGVQLASALRSARRGRDARSADEAGPAESESDQPADEVSPAAEESGQREADALEQPADEPGGHGAEHDLPDRTSVDVVEIDREVLR